MIKSTLHGITYSFKSVADLLSKANEPKSGDDMAGVSSSSSRERIAARYALSDLPLSAIYENPSIPYEKDEVTRVIIDSVDALAFAKIKNYSVGELRDFLLSADPSEVEAVRAGLTAEMISAITKLMSNGDLIYAAKKLRVTAT